MPFARSLTLPIARRRRRARPHARRSSATDAAADVAEGGGKAAAEDAPVTTAASVRWSVEIEVEFAEQRLGVRLREVLSPAADSPFAAEVGELPGPRRGGRTAATAAELYNWSAPPARRLAEGMRLTRINAERLDEWSYARVVRTLQLAGRPVRLRFASPIKRGERLDGEGEEDEGDERLARLCRQRADELARELVARELRGEQWRLARRHAERSRARWAARSRVLALAVGALADEQRALRAAEEALHAEQRRLERVLRELAAQAAPGATQPEVERARRLEERQARLLRDVLRLESANARLLRERQERRRALEDAECALQRLRPPEEQHEQEEDGDLAGSGVDVDLSALPLPEALDTLRRAARAAELALVKEQRRLDAARRERSQLLARLDTGREYAL